MTLYTFPEPEAAVEAYLAANIGLFPTGTTYSAKFPSASIASPHIQFAWDGTPSEDESREVAAIRVTVWTPRVNYPGGSTTAVRNLASLARALLLDFGSASVWRTTRGAGRTPGIDPDTELPFCTFTVNAETRPLSSPDDPQVSRASI